MRAATLQDSRFSFTIFILDQPPLLPPPTTSQQPSHNNHQPQRRFTTTATTFTVTPRNRRIATVLAPLVGTGIGLVQGARRTACTKPRIFRSKNGSKTTHAHFCSVQSVSKGRFGPASRALEGDRYMQIYGSKCIHAHFFSGQWGVR